MELISTPGKLTLPHGPGREKACPQQRQKQRLRLLPQAHRPLSPRPDRLRRMHVRLFWLADACHAANLKFVLAHALYLRAIHGGKNKNDRIDSEKIAHLLRSNLIPPAYVSIPLTNDHSAPCCANASTLSGGAPNCWPASSPINSRTTVSPKSKPAPTATPGRRNSLAAEPEPLPSARAQKRPGHDQTLRSSDRPARRRTTTPGQKECRPPIRPAPAPCPALARTSG